MIALVASLFVLFYVFVPGSIFRFATSLAVPLKKFQKTKTQEMTFAIVASLLPFWLMAGFCGVLIPHAERWHYPVNWPWASTQSEDARRADYQTVIAALLSTKQLDDAVAKGILWPAVSDVYRRQLRFLCWYYGFVVLEAWGFWYLISRYRRLKGWQASVAKHVLLPSVSEWHVILSDFAIMTDDAKKREIELDLLTTDNILYRGKLSEYFTNAEGELSGILLQRASRFEWRMYVEDKKVEVKPEHATPYLLPKLVLDTESYWTKIPGADLFYIPRERISNFNVRHELVDRSVAIRALLEKRGLGKIEVSEIETTKSSRAAKSST